MISFILLNNLNFSCCIGYPHAHVSTRKCLVNYHSWNVGVCSMVLTWPYPPNTVLKCLPFLLPLNSHVLFYSWEVLCWIWIGCHPGTEDISANEKQAIATNLFQDISVISITMVPISTITVHVKPQSNLILQWLYQSYRT